MDWFEIQKSASGLCQLLTLSSVTGVKSINVFIAKAKIRFLHFSIVIIALKLLKIHLLKVEKNNNAFLWNTVQHAKWLVKASSAYVN